MSVIENTKDPHNTHSDKSARMLTEIKLTEVGNFKIGNTQNAEAGTGCTVLIFESGAAAGLDIRGGGPASRESELLNPLASTEIIHAILLSGGSAFGLDAAGGVMQYLEEKKIGLEMGVTKVPLVCQSCLFDLTVGDAFVRPDKAMGYAACVAAEQNEYRNGNEGVGTGATVGKVRGMEFCMKSGVGSYAVQIGALKVGVVVAVNAIGDVFDYKTGQKIAGVQTNSNRAEPTTEANDTTAPSPLSAEDDLLNAYFLAADNMADNAEAIDNTAATTAISNNTTLGVVLTNANFAKSQLCKIASMAQDGIARSIRPVHTSMDGDSVYAVSLGEVPADKDVVGTLAARVMSEAILRAVQNAQSAYGFSGLANEAQL